MPNIDDVYNRLDADARMRLGPASGAPDDPIRSPAGEQVGLRRRYANGTIVWRQSVDQGWAVYGAIYALYSGRGEMFGELGWPTSDELPWEPRGRVSHFERGDIYWNGGDAYIVFPPPPPRATNPPVDGAWAVAPSMSGVVGVHAALLPPPARVLFFTFKPPSDPRADPAPQRYAHASVMDVATGRIDPGGPADLENVFCSGHAFDAEGRLIVVGGEREAHGVRDIPVRTVFAVDPGHTGGAGGLAAGWLHVGTTRMPRWYPTCAPLHDGSVLAVGGSASQSWRYEPNLTFEVIPAGIQPPISPELPTHLTGPTGFLGNLRAGSSYPFVFLLPNRKVLVHAGRVTSFIDTETWSVEPTTLATNDAESRTYHLSGTCVMLPLHPVRSGTAGSPHYPARILLIGGGRTGGIAEPANETCEVLDVDHMPLGWRYARSMANRRVMGDAVLLPDGTVLVVNGSLSGHADAGAAPVFDAEIYDPQTDTWRTVAPMSVPRLYHATALLLPDGRVLTAGTDASWNPPPFNRGELRMELYSPPYLFRGPRPTINSALENVDYSEMFTIETRDARQIDAVALVRCGSVTHSFNSDQRWVGVEILDRAAGHLTVQAPPDGYVAPPGYYLLFVLRDGIPSEGRYVQVGTAVYQRALTVNADTAARLLTVPSLGEVHVSASDPATSSTARFYNGSRESLLLEEHLTAWPSAATSTREVRLDAGGVHAQSFHVTSTLARQWTVVWRVRTERVGGPKKRISLDVQNAPDGTNVSLFRGSVGPISA